MNGFILSLKNQELILLFNGLLSNLTEAVLITDHYNKIQAVNSAFSILTGYSSDDVLGKKPWFLKSNRQGKQFFKDMLSKLANTGRWQGNVWNRKKNGEICLVYLSLQHCIFKDKSYYIGIFSKLSCSKKFVYENINHDPLTNLPNRTLFQDHLKFMIAHARRNNQILSLLLLDINRFKVMNETLGFNIGDTILVNTAQRLKEILREVDGVFRLGNDEFAIVLEEVSRMEDAAKVAKKILRIISNPYKLASYKEDLFISVSIGISLFPQDGTNSENLIKNAEAAMYQAKELEQNNFQLYSPTMNASAFEHMTLEHRLHKALEQKEFTLYYQPMVDIKTNRIVAAEALVRWKHPELGLVSPATFIPIAEETGLIIPIGDYIMEVACEKLKSWHTMGHNNMYISVNLSARQFQQHDLIQKIETILSHCRLSPKNLKLEITESISMKNAEETIITINKLKEKGIQISIDDFGTGYSSLGYLKKFPIDTLKIDQSFIRDIGEDSDCEAIISLIISMAHTLKLKVVAEGVETNQQLDFLKEKNCDLLQGYLFSRPLPENEFEKLLHDNINSKEKEAVQV